MSHYSYRNCPLLINGRKVFAKDVNLSCSNDLATTYVGNQRHSFDYVPGGPIQGSLNFSYYLTGNDFIKDFILEEDTFITGEFAGLSFSGGCLKSYSFAAQPNTPVVVNASVSFFDNIYGTFAPVTAVSQTIPALVVSDIVVSGIAGDVSLIPSSNINSVSYSFDSDFTPVYRQNDTVPYRISFKTKNLSSDVVYDNYDQSMSLSGQNALYRLILNNPANTSDIETYQINGSVTKKNLETSIDSIVKSSVSVRQNFVDLPPEITVFYPASGAPEEGFLIHGFNFQNTIEISLNGGLAYDVFDFHDGTQLTARIPYDAISGPITVKTYGGTVTSTDSFYVNDPGIQVYGFSPVSGNVGQFVNISGDNFYRLTDVIFGATGSVFNVINRNLIQATVPQYASYGKLNVRSTQRNQSGLSPFEFVPIPSVDSFTPWSGITGASIGILGDGFNSVTGVTFNNLQAQFTILNNTGLSAIVPSGNAKGYIRLNGYSGVTNRSSETFYPQVDITRLQPSTVYTGYQLIISGNAYIPELLYNTVGSKYLVRFSNTTGEFTRLNDHVLSGYVPSGTRTGPVQIYDSQQAAYSAYQTLTVRNPKPSVFYMTPQSGRTGDMVFGYGQDLFDLTGVKFSGFGSFYTSSSISNNLAGTTFTAVVPNAPTGIYDIFALNTEGSGILNTGYQILTPYVYASASAAFSGQNSGIANTLSFGDFLGVGPATKNDYILNGGSFPVTVNIPAVAGLNFGAGNGYARSVYVAANGTQNVNLYIANPADQGAQNITAGTWESANGVTGTFSISVF